MDNFRIEHDSLGPCRVPADRLYGSNTCRALENFPFHGPRLGEEPAFVIALARVKQAAALVNRDLGVLETNIAEAISMACTEMEGGQLSDHLVVPLLEGSGGTSTNMNVNEVLANRALEILGAKRGDYARVHPNDHVNRGQSTNDVIPSALKLACFEMAGAAVHSLENVAAELRARAAEFIDVYRLGRTCLQDAQPMTLGQAFGGYAALVARAGKRIEAQRQNLLVLPLGGTAIGTGLGSAPHFRRRVFDRLGTLTGQKVRPAADPFDGMQNIDELQRLSAELDAAATALGRIARDLITLSSGPSGGLAEISLPAVQPGSSIMPGKVNPVLPMAVVQLSQLVHGNHAAVTVATGEGMGEINHYEPLIGSRLFESLRLLTSTGQAFAGRCLAGITANRETCLARLLDSSALATSLVPDLGYPAVSALVRESIAARRPFLDLAEERGLLTRNEAVTALQRAARPVKS